LSSATTSSSVAARRWTGLANVCSNRTIGQPDKITVIFGRRITKHHHGKLQTEIEDINLPNPVIRSHYGNGFIKQSSVITLSSALKRRATMSKITASIKRSKISPSSAIPCQRSTTTISTCSRISLKPLLIVASYESSRSQQSHRPGSAFQVSNSITLVSSP
jgi:hypothetical protein